MGMKKHTFITTSQLYASFSELHAPPGKNSMRPKNTRPDKKKM